jgi:hypothetical protein
MAWVLSGIDWFAAHNCQTAGYFGWFVGIATGGLGNILIIGLIAISSKLGTNRPKPEEKWAGLRTWFQRCGGIGVFLALVAGGYHARAAASCYAKTVSLGFALSIGIFILLLMVTAANQIGARSVR